MSQKQTIDAEI